ncbi:MAG: TDP-4-dehydrorhamnose reductase [Acidobacteria bacterium]|nr:TDP-4-dehydrorhamnose reductase [Acidobacteriota bacterium]
MIHRWLITGAGGMVGIDLRNALELRGETVIPVTKAELDITDGSAVRELIRAKRPTIIVNCAAYTKVDDAEANEPLANAINGSAVELLAQAANDVEALLVQISTDFVFDGSQTTPYEVNAATNPLSAYGRSKRIGEEAAAHARKHLIVRTAWLFGVHGPNFVEAMRNQVKKGTNPLRVVNDQRGRPTYTPHLAGALIRLSLRAAESDEARGIVHYADEGEVSWYGFACAIVAGLGERTFDEIAVEPVSSAEFPRPAKRPAYSVLSTERYTRLTGVDPESWREGLQEYLTLRT